MEPWRPPPIDEEAAAAVAAAAAAAVRRKKHEHNGDKGGGVADAGTRTHMGEEGRRKKQLHGREQTKEGHLTKEEGWFSFKKGEEEGPREMSQERKGDNEKKCGLNFPFH